MGEMEEPRQRCAVRGSNGGHGWYRTTDLLRVKQALYH